MGFEMLLGNERLRENLSRSIERGHIAHFYLISGPEGSGKHTLARLWPPPSTAPVTPNPACAAVPAGK